MELQGVFQGVIENLLAAGIVAILGLASYTAVVIAERQRLLRFFGVSNRTPRIRFYLSRLKVLPGGTLGSEPITEGYKGIAINKIEYDGALLIRGLLSSSTLASFPKSFRDWLGRQHATLLLLDPKIAVSPQNQADISFENMVILGSGVYNLVAKYYLEHPSCCHFQFDKTSEGERGISIIDWKLGREKKKQPIPGREQKRELAILQRINDIEHQTSAFLCCGIGSSATYGTARYLAENWNSLYQQHGCEEFGILLGFPNQLPDSEQVVEPEVLEEWP